LTHVETKSKVRRRVVALVMGAVLAASVVACGREQNVADQPHVGGERFTRVNWEDVPLPTNGTKKSYKATKTNRTMVLEVPDTTADNALAWYDQQLTAQGWTKKTGPGKTVDGELVTYDRMGRTLAITAGQPASTSGPAPVSITLSFNKLAKS
jgi:hypothetical protein